MPAARIYVLAGHPTDYSRAELDYATALAWQLAFSKLILIVPPANPPDEHRAL